jgi:NAD(P)-dependent dehydrogenase (short-subunit alcohol dehydrogenase family)
MEQQLNRRLFEKVAVVTGASSGVGRSIALALARESAELALLGQCIARRGAYVLEIRIESCLFQSRFAR